MSDWQGDAERAVAETAQALKDPDTVYRGEHPLGKTWAITFSVNRDSDLLARTNWDVITADMQKRFPRSTDIERFSHWAVGWVDYLVVHMLNRKGEVTKAGIAALEWQGAIENYPVADDEEFSKREFEESHESIKSLVSVSDEDADRIWRVMWDANKNTSPDSMHGKDVEEALRVIRTEDAVKAGIPAEMVEELFEWVSDAGFDPNDSDDLEKVFAVVKHLRTGYHLSATDAKRVLDVVMEKSLDLLDPSAVRDVVASLSLRPEDIETLPLFQGYRRGFGDAPVQRPLHEIAREISREWKNVNYAARPYLEAMRELTSITDMYMMDTARSIVLYFLSNAASWRGDAAKRIKAELKAMLGRR